MKNGLRGKLSKDFIKIIQTGEKSDDETTGPVGCCKLKSYQVRSLCSRVAKECQDRPLKILEYYFPALNYRPVQENNDSNIFTCCFLSCTSHALINGQSVTEIILTSKQRHINNILVLGKPSLKIIRN